MSPLRRGGPLSRRTPLPRGAGLARTAWTPPPPRRAVTPAERRARQLVAARSGGVCEVCGAAPAHEFQHRKARVHGGTWTAGNGLHVCGHGNTTGCHGLIHQHPALAYERGWSVRSGHDPALVPVLLAAHGPVLLDAAGGHTPTTWSAA